jgi:hypothetical protein
VAARRYGPVRVVVAEHRTPSGLAADNVVEEVAQIFLPPARLHDDRIPDLNIIALGQPRRIYDAIVGLARFIAASMNRFRSRS